MSSTEEKCSPNTADNSTSLESIAWQLSGAPVDHMQQGKRLCDIISHYRWSQLARRGLGLVRSKMTGGKTISPTLVNSQVALIHGTQHSELARLVINERRNHSMHSACDLSSGQLLLLNQAATVVSDGQFDLKTVGAQTHLWRFQFHYHEFLLTTISKGERVQVEHYLRLWLQQYDGNQVRFRDDAWHPYCISRRVVSWIFLLLHPEGIQDESLRVLMLNSIEQQCELLARKAEYELGGNHLLENATALAIVGRAVQCDGSNGWVELASQIFAKELPQQILASGEHYERSPVYHCHVVSNLLRVLIVSGNEAEIGMLVKPYVQTMLAFLESILHPDGEVPLFADSVFLESPSVAEIKALESLCSVAIDNRGASSARSEDYTAFKSKNLFALFDHGPIAANHLPAHAHCDALNLEVSIEGQRWIVDSGNFDYEDSAMRHYCRSSLAHNVVTVGNNNQANIWSKFRMGSRPTVFGVRRGSQENWQWASGSHNAYKRNNVPEMTRLVASYDDALFCCDSWKAGSKATDQMIGYIHFHPDVCIQHTDSSNGYHHFALTSQGVSRDLTVLADSVSIEQGWYCSEFGKRLESPVVMYVRDVSASVVAWVVHDSKAVEIRADREGKFSLYCDKRVLKCPEQYNIS